MNCKQAREISIIDIAIWLNIDLKKGKRKEFWGKSPFRNENTPSFKLNPKLNTWVDFGASDYSGCEKAKVVCGDGIELVKRVKGFTTSQALQFLESYSGIPSHSRISTRKEKLSRISKKEPKSSEGDTEVLKVTEIKSKELLRYATKRKIPHSILLRFCKEVHYFNKIERSAIGIINESNNWEINAEYSPKNFKRSFGRKDISLINPGRDLIWVTEGFFDFLSLLVLRNKFGVANDSFMILHGVGQVNRSIEFLENYNKINLVLDNDEASKPAVEKYESIFKNIENLSFKYQNYKDINEYLINK